MAKPPSELWDDCLVAIKGRLTQTQYSNFFEPVAFESFDKKTRTLLLQVPNRSLVEYLEGSFLPLLNEVLAAHYGQIRLQYHVTAAAAANANTVIDTAKNQSEGDITIATNLNPHYTFDTFIEGDSNRLARSVGISIAEHPRKTNFNPMFVYGPSGCGKTHLINAVGNYTCKLYPRKKVLYVPARDFQRQYTTSISQNNFNDFMQFYQQFDMLIVDDVQEWESSIKTSETFFHIFNHLFMSGKRIVLAADRTPVELKNMDERMLSRFTCGILTELEKPNKQLCYDILKAKIRRDGLAIPDDVVDYIAGNANGSVRDLEGIINSLLAHSIFVNSDITIDLVGNVIARIRRTKPTKLDGDQVLRVVCKHFEVSKDDILGKSHRHEHVLARQAAMYFAYKLAKMNINMIGRTIGNRNHATVAYGIKQVAAVMEKDEDFARRMKAMENEIVTFRK
ncbi:MAG: chromosomal replication initiator protein DnaA [Prevotella sp.]|nr:chromosomal replication initiator protein DnaA [Prevotella sp.]